MHTAFVRLTTLLALLSAAGSANAQPQSAPIDELPRAFVGLNAGAQLTRSDFTDRLTFRIYGEDAAVDSQYRVPAGPLIDVGGGVRLAGRLAGGVAVSRHQSQGSAAVDARIPHPLLPASSRPLVDTVVDLDRTETAVHTFLAWLVPVGPRLVMAVCGGPTGFRVEQDLMAGLDLHETYPFDEVTLERAATARRSDSTVGFHIGTDVLFRLRERLGLGGLVRYSRGTLEVDVGGTNTRLRTGGLQISGGMRWLF